MALSPALALLTQRSQRSRYFWLGLSMMFAVIYGSLALQQAFASDYVVQDDARQHIFWMQRFLDPALFPNDLIADYFQAAAPIGYEWLYRSLAMLGFTPDFVSKVLPFFLGVITVGYGFFLSLEIFPLPFAAFISAALLNQALWGSDEISSATPRAFLYPLLIAFLLYVLRQARWRGALVLVLQAIFYPPIILISVGVLVLRLAQWQKGRFRLSTDWHDYSVVAAGMALILALAFYTGNLAEFGSIVSRAEAQTMPEFQPGGRNAFFRPDMAFWLDGYPGRSGIFHRRTSIPVTSWVGLLLPWFLWSSAKTQTSLRQLVRPHVDLLGQLLVVSFGLFLLAHLLLFELHLPSRYTSHTIRVVLVLAAGMVWVFLFEALFQWGDRWSRSATTSGRSPQNHQLKRWVGKGFPLLFVATFFITTFFYYPLFLNNYPKTAYYDLADSGELYEFFQSQPQDSLIASLSNEASNIPSFAGRSVLVSQEHGLAYHTEYYRQFRQRVIDLLIAQYTDEPAVVAAFIQQYGVDFWLLDHHAFAPTYVSDSKWMRQFQPVADQATEQIAQGQVPIVSQAVQSCAVFERDRWTVLDANCVARSAQSAP
ncbi:hypothetical protein [Halomicronema sp. CCY15110]|uniref:hypothetical protein n=1 Tax=Halomicronema sp. CCY15110 TaxID=2767773 RepID=UPI00194F0B5C|nr:hypothetical protein [Halomicronema sp. CCY15110]